MARVGLNVGGVIIDCVGNDHTDTAFRGQNFMLTTAVHKAFRSTRLLVSRFGKENVFIISESSEVVKGKTRRWLDGHSFYNYTGFDRRNLYFCEQRTEKAPIARKLELTHFVDYRLEVLQYMGGVVPHRLLFGPQSDNVETPGVTRVLTWDKALSVINETLAS